MKTARASVLPIFMGLVLFGIYLIFQAVPILVSDASIAQILDLVSLAYTYLMIPLYVILYFWTGSRAVKKFGADAVGAGLVAAFSYLVTGLVSVALGTILNLIVLSQIIGMVDFRSPESVLAAAVLGDLTGRVGVLVSALCGVGLVAIGILINFTIGSLGGLFSIRGKR